MSDVEMQKFIDTVVKDVDLNIELACEDAFLYGTGFISFTQKDGFKRLSAKEAYDVSKAILENGAVEG